jgi:hypothetical protein
VRVDEHADLEHPGRYGRKDLARLPILDEALGTAPEVEANGARAFTAGNLGVLGPGDAADFDEEAHGAPGSSA